MNRMLQTLLRYISVIALTGCGNVAPPTLHTDQPNIILINIDDLGWADLGCYGHPYHETPNIDRLAAAGTRFTNAYAAAAICSPTRAALMTGKAPARLGITDWIRARFQGGNTNQADSPAGFEGGQHDSLLCPTNPLHLALDETTLAEVLKTKAYTTGHIGKWHLGTDDWYPEKQGFDSNIGGCDYGQPPSYFDPYDNEKLSGIPGLPPRKTGEYLSDRLADEAVSFIIAQQEGPFFLHLADYAVHTPIQAKPALIEKYQEAAHANGGNPVYAAMVESMDAMVGRVVDAVDSLGIGQRTLIVFTSDNGGLLQVTNNGPLRSGKGFPYEGGIRVPLIVRQPDFVPSGKTSKTPVISYDWLPTFASLIHAEMPDNLDGVNIADVLQGCNALERENLYWHFPHYRYQDEVPYSVIRQGDWKLIKRYQGLPYELFDLASDPGERQNIANRFPELVADLNTALTDWLASAGALLPKANPNYLPK